MPTVAHIGEIARGAVELTGRRRSTRQMSPVTFVTNP